jgi:hypothetical protein
MLMTVAILGEVTFGKVAFSKVYHKKSRVRGWPTILLNAHLVVVADRSSGRVYYQNALQRVSTRALTRSFTDDGKVVVNIRAFGICAGMCVSAPFARHLPSPSVFSGFGPGLPASTTTTSSEHSTNTRVFILVYHPHWLRDLHKRVNQQLRQQVRWTVLCLEEKKDVA